MLKLGRKRAAFLLCCLLLPITPLKAETTVVEIVDYRDGQEAVLQTFSTLKSAADYYAKHRHDESVVNLGVRQDGKLIAVDQGIVFFASEGCKVNTEYKDADTGNDGYLNGCYGADGAALDTDFTKMQVEFKLSGVRGKAKLAEVTLVPLSEAGNLSSYTVREGRLYHQIRQSQSSSRYATMIDLGPVPANLSSYGQLYSYDGHYFYEDSAVMLQDYQKGSTAASINSQEPFYFYYQYLSHRSLSYYTEAELTAYFQQTLGIDQSIVSYQDRDRNSVHDTLNQSLYYGEEGAFLQAQSLYGSNALMMLALSMNESASGRSSLSFTRNNLFGHAAYDSDVEANAKRYFKLSSSILSHAKTYVSASYLNPKKFQYHGGFFGDKASGMNVSYASDPYWGEKAASYYMQLDEAMGSKDLNQLTLGIHTQNVSLSIYSEPSSASAVLYSTGKTAPLAFVLLEKIENGEGSWYKVQSEAAVAEDYTYRFEECIGYLPASSFDVILNADRLNTLQLKTAVFDAGEGTFPQGGSRIEIDLLENSEPYAPEPTKENSVLVGWQENNGVYLAEYKAIQEISMVSLPQQQYAAGSRIDLKKGKVQVKYMDGTEEELPLTSSMVSGFDLNSEGVQTVTVSVGTVSTSYEIEVSEELNQLQDALKEDLDALIEAIDPAAVTEQQKTDLLKLKQRLDTTEVTSWTIAQIRALDTLLKPLLDNQRSLILKSKDSQFSVSGLSLALPQTDPGQKKWIKDTYKLTLKQAKPQDEVQRQAETIASGNGAAIEQWFTVSGQKNYDSSLTLRTPLCITMSLPEGWDSSKKVTVWRLEDGDVIQMPTTQSALTLTFTSEALGQFVLTSRQTVNQYEDTPPVEVMTIAQNGLDWPQLMIKALIAVIALLILFAAVLILQRRADKKRRRALAKRAKRQRQIHRRK